MENWGIRQSLAYHKNFQNINFMSNSILNLAQVGCGYWGPNLLRNFHSLIDCKVSHVVEPVKERKEFIHSNFPDVCTDCCFEEILANDEIKAIIIATPAKYHFDQARLALLAGKHVFVEKPMAQKVDEVKELQLISEKLNLICMVGHTFLFNPAVRYVKSMIEKKELGKLYYIYSQRLNLGRIRSDVNALWNFAPHDVSIIQYWLNENAPLSVAHTGSSFIQNGVEDVSFLNLKYPNGVMANIHVSWLDPNKTRKITIVGSKKMVVYDDLAINKITVFDKGIDIVAQLGENMDFDNLSDLTFNHRSGNIFSPKIQWKEPLRTEAEHFIECIKGKASCITGPEHAKKVVDILERAEQF